MKKQTEPELIAVDEADATTEGEVAEQLAWVVDVASHGDRLDRYLVTQVSSVSRSYLSQLITQSAVHLNGVLCVKPAQKVKAGDAVSLELRPTQQAMAFKPDAVALDVLFEDDHLAVLNKPAGLVVHPGAGHWTGTLLNGLLYRYPDAVHLPRAGIVHRLDKDTSGLMVVARSRLGFDNLTKALAAREIHRVYLAIAQGAWQRSEVGGRRSALPRPLVEITRTACGWLHSMPSPQPVSRHAPTSTCLTPKRTTAWCVANYTRGAPIKSECTFPPRATPWWGTCSTAASRWARWCVKPCMHISCPSITL